MTGAVHVDHRDKGVTLITIDHVPMNTMSRAMIDRMCATLAAIEDHEEVRTIVLTGKGTIFCAGADLNESGKESSLDNYAAFGAMLEQVATCRIPVVAAINGPCVGGGLELALCCDIRLAATDAKFVCAGVNVGLMASTYRLPRLIGLARAKAMLLTGSPHDAETAERWGLVTGVFEGGRLLDEALAIAARVASRAPLSVEATKRNAERALSMSAAEAARLAESELSALNASDDHREALAAFMERREPVFHRR